MAKESTSAQAWLVGLMGLLGVLLGGLITFGADLAKAHLDHEREKENVTRALLVEVRELTRGVAVQRNWWRTYVDPQKELQPLIPYRTDVYGHYSAKMDLLDPDLAQRIEEFYVHIHFVNDFQQLKAFYSTTPDKRIDFYCRYDRILGVRFEEKFGPSDASIFASYYRSYGLALGDSQSIAPVAENPVCKKLAVRPPTTAP